MQVGWSAKKSAYTFRCEPATGRSASGFAPQTGTSSPSKGAGLACSTLASRRATAASTSLRVQRIRWRRTRSDCCRGSPVLQRRWDSPHQDAVLEARRCDRCGQRQARQAGAKSIASLLKPKSHGLESCTHPKVLMSRTGWGIGASKQVVELVANQAGHCDYTTRKNEAGLRRLIDNWQLEFDMDDYQWLEQSQSCFLSIGLE